MRRSAAICAATVWISILLAASGLVWGQGALSELHGNVSDPSGAAIANAAVHLTDVSNNSDHSTITDQRGRYAFTDLDPGTYRLLIVVAGFETYEQADIYLVANVTTTLDVKLKISQVQQSITVKPQSGDRCLDAQARIFPDIGPGLRAIRRGPSGNYYVLTAPGAAAAIYAPNGKRIAQVPTASSIASQPGSAILNGTDLQVDSVGRVYIADLAANAIKIYSAQGALVGRVRVPAPISVEPLPEGEVAVASLYSKYFVDVYNEAHGEVYRSFGDISGPVEKCDPAILRCTEETQDTQPKANRPWFNGDSAGNVYVDIIDPKAPTIRKYDDEGIRAYEFTLPLNQGNNSDWTVNSTAVGGRATTGAGQAQGTGAGSGGMRSGRQGRMQLGLELMHHGQAPDAKPAIDAIGVDPANSEVWAAIGANLLHLDQQGELDGYYCLSTSGETPIKVSTILVEPNRILVGIDPFGVFQYSRPDKPSPAASVTQ
jgi:hypothetical protein